MSNKAIEKNFAEIPAPEASALATATHVQFGKVIQPQQQILLYASDEWEAFIQEWAHSLKSEYGRVLRFAGANDMGIDVAGLADDQGLKGIWDNFQCKHYDDPLTPSIASREVAKILWHSFNGHYVPPRHYYFIAPKECGMKLKRMLVTPGTLKKYIFENWDNQCAKAVTADTEIKLEGEFHSYADNFPYEIFKPRTTLEIIDTHRKTPYFAVRFGGGLPARPASAIPPASPASEESRYIEQLFEAYSDHTKQPHTSAATLTSRPDLVEHLSRQREFFYHAESLRNFSRDTVPAGTFEELKSEVYAGVVDIEASSHIDGYARLNSVTLAASQLQMTSNALMSVVKIQDKKGICHQLANENRLRWRKP